MGKLCERPGCSEVASLAYGMRIDDLVFWLDVLDVIGDSASSVGGVLCQRHGDSMVVPRGWTLDDLRDPDLHLFRPPTPADRAPPFRSLPRRSETRTSDDTQQLELAGLADSIVDRPDGSPPDVGCDGDAPEIDDSGRKWTPSFDEADDLDGLLAARSPLLSRAFRSADRPG